MTRQRLALGRLGEEMALGKIERLGYKCITRNYRCPFGEIDLIAKDGDTLVFIEIKTRKGKSLHFAKEAITEKKKRRLSRIALAYMKANDCFDTKSRFDVVAISIREEKKEIEVVQNAFDMAYG